MRNGIVVVLITRRRLDDTFFVLFLILFNCVFYKELKTLMCVNRHYLTAALNTVFTVFLSLFVFWGFRSLLILDDIWDSTVLKSFDIHSRILLTTRNRSLADSVSGMSLVFLLGTLYTCKRE